MKKAKLIIDDITMDLPIVEVLKKKKLLI